MLLKQRPSKITGVPKYVKKDTLNKASSTLRNQNQLLQFDLINVANMNIPSKDLFGAPIESGKINFKKRSSV